MKKLRNEERQAIDFIKECIENEIGLKVHYEFNRDFSFFAAGISYDEIEQFKKDNPQLYCYYIDFWGENEKYAEKFNCCEPALQKFLDNAHIMSSYSNKMNKKFWDKVKNDTFKLKKEYFPPVFILNQEWTVWNDDCTASREMYRVKCDFVDRLEDIKKEYPDKKGFKTDIRVYDIDDNIEEYIYYVLNMQVFHTIG